MGFYLHADGKPEKGGSKQCLGDLAVERFAIGENHGSQRPGDEGDCLHLVVVPDLDDLDVV